MTCVPVRIGNTAGIACGSFPKPKPLFFKRVGGTAWRAEDLIIAKVTVAGVDRFELRRDDKTLRGHWIGAFETTKQARAAAEQCRAGA